MPDNILTPVGNLRGQLTAGGLIPGLPMIIGTASGAVASFNDGTNNTLIELIIGIKPFQEGSGDPSPGNERLLHGWTGVEIHVADGATPHIVDNTYNVTWQDEAGTVYSGRINITTGELTVNSARVDLGSLNWLYDSTYNRFYTTDLYYIIKRPATNNEVLSGLYAEIYKTVSDNATAIALNNYSIGCSLAARLDIRNTDYNNPAQFKTAMNGKYIVYPLATSTTYQLTPTQVMSIIGTNNIFADTGDVISCKYIANVEMFLQWVYDNLYNP